MKVHNPKDVYQQVKETEMMARVEVALLEKTLKIAEILSQFEEVPREFSVWRSAFDAIASIIASQDQSHNQHK